MQNKIDTYKALLQQLHALLDGEHDMIANMANIAALIYHNLPDINWAGFYLYKHGELILGPFQGNVACMHIPLGKGVCGSSAQQQCIQRIHNVHEFVGHIACDINSKSELVIPLIKENTLIGVFDIDAPIHSRFDDMDEYYLSKVTEILLQSL